MAYNAELQMLREIVWLLLGHPSNNRLCIFCGKRLLTSSGMTYGHRRHPKITEKLTIHHVDETRSNNAMYNLTIVHTTCHKTYHAAQRSQDEYTTS